MIKKIIKAILILYLVSIQILPVTAKFIVEDRLSESNDIIENEPQYIENFYLPLIAYKESIKTVLSTRRINAPYFDVANVVNEKLSELAIAWFGQVTPTLNYADIRVGYNDEALFIHLEVFDRLLWYDRTPVNEEFQNWDSATLYLNLDGNTGSTPNTQTYRFDAQLNWWEDRENYQAAYRWNGASWDLIAASFYTQSGWRGNAPNDNVDDRGWIVVFRIPFAEMLGLSGRPANGTIWGMGIKLYDRDDAVGTLIENQSWPENVNGDSPDTWGQLHYGLPIFSPPAIEPAGSVTIRHKLDGIVVKDAAVGGTTTNLCPGDPYFIWNVWGNLNFTDVPDFNVQNQGDVADWPCFAKYYITFPFDNIPLDKEIISAKLILYQFGNSGDVNDPDPINRPHPSLIQVLSVVEEWDGSSITWNNAPLALENISQAWVEPLSSFPGWPGEAREWDVSYSATQAYSLRQPLRLVLYEADAARHSGKYFSSSDTDDWNANGRPTLIVTWGDR